MVDSELLILYNDGSLGLPGRQLYAPADNSVQEQIIWSEQTTDIIVAVFRDKVRLLNDR